MQLNTIILGDCGDLLKEVPDNTIDCCITDPPYGWKFMGKKWDYEIPGVKIWQEVLRVLKPGAHILVAFGTRTQHRMVVNIEDAGFEIRDVICWHYGSGFPKSLDISKAIDKSFGITREVVSVRKAGSGPLKNGHAQKGGGGGFIGPERSPELKITIPSSEDSKKWSGWGTALKAATEFWTLARKPISEGNIAANVIKYGTGALNIDDCRIEFLSEEDKKSATFGTGTSIIGGNYAGGNHILDKSRKNIEANNKGRFPANIILDEFMASEMDLQSGQLTSGQPSGFDRAANKTHNIYGKFNTDRELTGYGDTGGASRFFYIAKASATERNQSSHPTIKPQILIQYLIKLICPIETGRIILDPFSGSGSHCIAARKLGLDFMGFEIGEKECQEANERLQKEMGLFI